jgi:2,4-dienoyl-CoA reductase-like NADH-dependent reductase (Old Yellow Enzyme family)
MGFDTGHSSVGLHHKPEFEDDMSSDAIDALFTPFEYGEFTVRNRIVMAPMTRYGCPGGRANDAVAAYYRRRAQGGVGLILSEGIFVDRAATCILDDIPSCDENRFGSWRTVIDAVHSHGAAFAPQLWHVGASRDLSVPDLPPGLVPESPSGISALKMTGGKALTEEDIADVTQAFVAGALRAKALGFDAVEFHGAHGYLFDQFFWSATNKRTDRFGGTTIGQRAAFAAEVVRQVRSTIGPSFPLIFRISQWKAYFYDVKLAYNPNELEAWLRPLVDAGVDLFDCSQRRFYVPEFPGSDLNLAGWVKKISGLPTITVGSVGLSTDMIEDLDQGGASRPVRRSVIDVAERLARGEFDLVAVGRSLIADADWPRKVREARFDQIHDYSAQLLQTLQ